MQPRWASHVLRSGGGVRQPRCSHSVGWMAQFQVAGCSTEYALLLELDNVQIQHYGHAARQHGEAQCAREASISEIKARCYPNDESR
jgi:hypothetical protein